MINKNKDKDKNTDADKNTSASADKDKNINTFIKTQLNKQINTFIKTQINKQINEYDLSINNIKKMEHYFKGMAHMIMILIIKNNKLYILFPGGDSRKKKLINFIKSINSYLINKPIKDTIIPFLVADIYFYHNNDIPFLIEAKPENKKGILFPDTSNFDISIDKKNYTYDNFVNLLENKQCTNIANKISVIHFTGANTGADKHNVRMKLKQINNKKEFDIHIGETYAPIYNFCKYKYLLNLPGHQPWSYRLMKILLMKSLVISVEILQSYDDGKNFNSKWINFYSTFFKPNVDYIEIIYKWIEGQTKDTQVFEIYKEIYDKFIYYEKNKDKFLKIVNSSFDKTKLLNIKLFKFSLNEIINSFTNKLYKINKETEISQYIDFLLEFYKKDIISLN